MESLTPWTMSIEFLFVLVKWCGNFKFYAHCPRCERFHLGPYPGVSFFGMGFDSQDRRFFETEWRFHGALSSSINTGLAITSETVFQEIEKRRPLQHSAPT